MFNLRGPNIPQISKWNKVDKTLNAYKLSIIYIRKVDSPLFKLQFEKCNILQNPSRKTSTCLPGYQLLLTTNYIFSQTI